ncbi:MAG: 23S rRNA (uracil(1939)-C(5))-methyltransferase RlmD [Gammaproteobacteria bacterium]|nr:23S rRNA (uracil(1939)-C(5))-methyltransferase RlmD [Gammaproteobacteria bacterium]
MAEVERGKVAITDLPERLLIDHLDSRGRGIAHHGQLRVVCDGALPGEVIRATRYERSRRHVIAQAYTIEQAAEARVTPLCRYFGECGGCQLQHARYDAQLAYKESHLKQNLAEYGDVSPLSWLPALPSSPFHYRRRVRLSARMGDEGDVILGFHRKLHSYLLDISACPVLEPRMHMLLEPLHAVLAQLSVRHRLPQIEMSCGDQEVAVVFRHLLPLSNNDRSVLRHFAELHDVLVFTQAAGPESLLPLISEQMTSLQYSFPKYQTRLVFAPTDFIQANAQVNQNLVAAMMQLLDVQEHDVILDLFCGIGNFSLPLARYARSVIGVEGHPALVAQAQFNAEHNGLRNVQFRQADLNTWVPDVAHTKLLIDPPREGAIEIIKRLPGDSAETIVYVSCMPKTLARDARYLVHQRGYTLTKAGIVDMFPQTRHVETIAVFQR